MGYPQGRGGQKSPKGLKTALLVPPPWFSLGKKVPKQAKSPFSGGGSLNGVLAVLSGFGIPPGGERFWAVLELFWSCFGVPQAYPRGGGEKHQKAPFGPCFRHPRLRWFVSCYIIGNFAFWSPFGYPPGLPRGAYGDPPLGGGCSTTPPPGQKGG